MSKQQDLEESDRLPRLQKDFKKESVFSDPLFNKPPEKQPIHRHRSLNNGLPEQKYDPTIFNRSRKCCRSSHSSRHSNRTPRDSSLGFTDTDVDDDHKYPNCATAKDSAVLSIT